MSKHFIWLLLFAAGTLLAQEDPRPNWGLGPIGLDNQYILAWPHLSLRPASPAPLAADKFALRFETTWSNTCVLEPGYRVDAEAVYGKALVSFGLYQDVTLWGEIPFQHLGAGVLDRLIDDYHQAFGFSRGDRDDVKNNSFSVAGRNRDRSRFSYAEESFALASPVLGARYLLSAGSTAYPAVAVQARLGLPGLGAELSQDAVDFELALLASKRWGGVIIYAGGSTIAVTDSETENVEYAPFRYSGFFYVEYELSPRVSLEVGLWAESKLVESVSGHPAYAMYLDFGLSYALAAQAKLDFVVRENPAPQGGTMDVSFGCALTYQFL